MKIELLVGMVASGKSTYAKRRAQDGAIIVNDDAIVQAVHGGNYFLYKPKLKPLYKSIENHILYVAIASLQDVVVDKGVNIRKQSRVRWISLARSLDCEIVAIVFPKESAETHAKRRYSTDNRKLPYETWLKVAKIHEAEYSEPTLDEGFSKIIYAEEFV